MRPLVAIFCMVTCDEKHRRFAKCKGKCGCATLAYRTAQNAAARLGSPKVLEPRWRKLGVAHVLNVPVAEVGLQRACVVALVRQCIAAGMSQHVRVSLEAQSCLDAGALDHACESCRGE